METDEPTKGDSASPSDLRLAIEGLTPTEAARIKKAASYCMFGTEFQDPMELVNEAVKRAMNAACGDKGRNWKTSVPFVPFMAMTIRGIANDSVESVQQTRTIRAEEWVTEGGSYEDALAHKGHFHRDVVELATEIEHADERETLAKIDADIIDKHFIEDQEIGWILMGHREGMSSSDIMDISGMTQTQYDTGKRRLRRGLDKLFPNRRKP